MLSMVRDLPDGAVGLAIAGTLHFGLCYGVLAPRAMEAHLSAEVTPICTAALSAEQDRALEDAQEEYSQVRLRAQTELGRAETQLNALEQVTSVYEQSGLNDLFGALGVPTQSISNGDLDALRAQADRMRSILQSTPDFSHLTANAGQLMQTCRCAALQAAMGQRTSYAVSLATFRLVQPAEVAGVTDATLQAVGGSVCGELPWRQS